MPIREPEGNSTRLTVILAIAISSFIGAANHALADEGGVSFWLPGQYGSFAAIAPEQGFSMPLVTYYYSGGVSGEQALGAGGEVRLGLDTQFLGQFVVPTYTPDTTILGGQPSFSLLFELARSDVNAGLATGTLSGSVSDSITGIGDLFPAAQIFWNQGVHNYMAYATGNIPVGNYDPNRLSNIGLGHAAIDFGGAYTYLNEDTGWEFSSTGGITFNFENPDTNYTNGTSLHLDIAASRFVSESTQVGLVGYAYQQITADEGQSNLLGDFKSRTFGVGPQIGVFFGDSERPSYLNLRVYWEFDAKNRVEGGGAFLTLSFPLD